MHTESCIEIFGFLIDDDLHLRFVLGVSNNRNIEREFIEIVRDFKIETKTEGKTSLICVVLPVMVSIVIVSNWLKGKL